MGKDFAISQVPRGALVNGEPGNNAIASETFMGYTVRTVAWRYTSWVRFDNLTGAANWSEAVGRELYPQTLGKSCAFDTDSSNEVSDSKHSEVVVKLEKLLHTIVALKADDEQVASGNVAGRPADRFVILLQ